MPTRKSTKKARKKSAKNKGRSEGLSNARSKRGSSKKAGLQRTGGKKAGAKKSAAAGKGSKKAATKGGTRKDSAQKAVGRAAKKSTARGFARTTKAAAKAAPTAEALALVGNCLGLVEAGAIVENAVVSVGGISPSSYDVDKKMEQMGVITANHCTLVKQMILNDVRAFPCDINDGAVSFDPSTVARVVRDQVKDNAARPSQ